MYSVVHDDKSKFKYSVISQWVTTWLYMVLLGLQLTMRYP